MLLIFIYIWGETASAATWYVKPGGTGTGSVNWANAAPSTQLASVVAAAASGDQVWVVGSAGGVVYYPTTGASRTAAFTLTSGVAVYGGFAGTETLLSQRNYNTHITILSGDIGIAGNNSDNSFHVVVSAGNTGTTVLDGFTIENGNANGAAGNTDNYNGVGFAGDEQTGAGLMTYNTTVTISNCIVKNNTATGTGGGVYSYGTAVTYTSCTFSTNTSAADGGGMYISANGGGGYTINSSSFTSNIATGSGGGLARENGSVTVSISGCSFTSNSSAITGSNVGGGGIYLVNGGLTMTSCTISNNTSAAWGGGILYNQGSNSPVSYCTISTNNSVYGGGMANLGGSSPLLTNNNFSQNSATYGGGLYCNDAGTTISVDTFANNTATATSGMAGGGLLDDNGSNSTVSHCWFSGNVTNGGDGAGQYDNNSAGTDSNCIYQANIGNGAASNGGGLYHNGGTGSAINCVFADNACTGNGGGVYNFLNSETYENCTFYNNSSGNSITGGDGIYVANNTKPHITNDIIWSTNASSVGLVVGSGTPKINYSDIQGHTLAYLNGLGGNNQNTAPTFTNAGSYSGPDGAWGTSDDGLHLANGSVGADAVAGTAPTNFPVDDIADAIRPDVAATNADMGAYEGPGGAVVLAIRQLSFNGSTGLSGLADLSWQIDAGRQPAVFHIQRSTNGADFSEIGEVAMIPNQTSYSYTDQNDVEPVNYYRLRIEQNGMSDWFSSIVIINIIRPVTLSLRPSMVQGGSTTLYLQSPQDSYFLMNIYDASGRTVAKKSLSGSRGDNYIPIDLGGLPKGIYYMSVVGNGAPGQVILFGKL